MSKKGDIDLALQLYIQGKTSITEIRQICHVSNTRLYRAIHLLGMKKGKNGIKLTRIKHVPKTNTAGVKEDGLPPVTNILHVQNAYGDEFIKIANQILNGEVEFGI